MPVKAVPLCILTYHRFVLSKVSFLFPPPAGGRRRTWNGPEQVGGFGKGLQTEVVPPITVEPRWAEAADCCDEALEDSTLLVAATLAHGRHAKDK